MYSPKQHATGCASHKMLYDGDMRNRYPDARKECDCDGYHTFDELYDHRHLLYIALCKTMTTHDELCAIPVWRSKSHSDGSMFEGMFIIGIGEEPGKQITYHLPLSLWDQTSFARNYETAPEWDGHTPEDVLNRLIIL